MKFYVSWTNNRGEDVGRLIWFETQQRAEQYAQWVERETGRKLTIKPIQHL